MYVPKVHNLVNEFTFYLSKLLEQNKESSGSKNKNDCEAILICEEPGITLLS